MMKTVGDKITPFLITGVRPGVFNDDEPPGAFEMIDENSFLGWWKVIVFYPKDFTFVCPTEIVGYDNLIDEFESRYAKLLVGNTDNEYVKLAWRNNHEDLKKTRSWMFADTFRDERCLSEQLGIFHHNAGACLRATFIVDPNNVIQHVTVNDLNVGRSPEETLRILDGLSTGGLCDCNRPIGGATL
jgi:peroxiredoxin (alkyl hydroperoxide reductase subunit C)